jgi:hypothetical protein
LHDIGEELARALLARIPSYSKSFPPTLVRKLSPLKLREGESG